MSVGTEQQARTTKRQSFLGVSAILPDPDRLCDFLRGEHPQNTCHHVEALTGIPAGTVEKWLLGKSAPGFRHFGALIAVYGAELLASVYETPPRWLDREAKDAKRAEIARKIEALRAEAARLEDECGE